MRSQQGALTLRPGKVQMTENPYTVIARLSYTVNVGLSMGTVSVYASSGSYFGFLLRDERTKELMLPVRAGANFTLGAENATVAMAAFPARLGNPDGEWLNLFPECPETDPALMPSTGGLLEVIPNGSFHFDGLCLPGGQKARFVANPDGTRHQGRVYDRFEVCYRFPTNPDAIPGVPAGAVAKGRGVSIGTGAVVGENRSTTNLDYQPDAYSFGVIRLVDRVKVAQELAQHGLHLDPNNDHHWSAGYGRDNGLTPTDFRLGEIN